MRFLAPETAQARTRQILEEAKRAKEEEQHALESVQNFQQPEEQIADTTEMPAVSEIPEQEAQKTENSTGPEKNPVPIQDDEKNQDEEKNPAPISTFSESPTTEEAEKNNIKVIISDILDTFPDEKLAELCEKYTKNDKRWKRTRQLEELIKADLTLDQLYS
jgi:hypothetical protein